MTTLDSVDVNVHCAICGDFTVRADTIAEAQRLLENGCPGSTYECPPELLAGLLEPSALRSLQAWSVDLEPGDRASSAARPGTLHVGIGPPFVADPRALARWEDDGGYVGGTRDARDVLSRLARGGAAVPRGIIDLLIACRACEGSAHGGTS